MPSVPSLDTALSSLFIASNKSLSVLWKTSSVFIWFSVNDFFYRSVNRESFLLFQWLIFLFWLLLALFSSGSLPMLFVLLLLFLIFNIIRMNSFNIMNRSFSQFVNIACLLSSSSSILYSPKTHQSIFCHSRTLCS